MDTTKDQQIALDDALIAPANCLRIGKCNHRLSSSLKSNESTIQVVLDALKLTPFYKEFEVTANVPEIYMQEFWATNSVHHKSLRFKMNNKGHTFNLENFRDMLQIYPRLRGQKFEDPPFEEEILSFIRDLGHTGEIKLYGAILPDELINQEIKDSEAYKQYYAVASAAEPLKSKTKYKKKADERVTPSMPNSAPKVKEIALSEPEQMKIVTKGNEHISWNSSDEDDDDEVSMSKHNDDNDENADDDDKDDDNQHTESDIDADDFVHPRFYTHDKEVRQNEEDKEEEGSDLRINEEEEENELYRDVNINLEGRDTKITNDLQPNVQATKVIEDTHVIITTITLEVQQQSSSVSSGFISNMINPNPNTGIDFILNLNTESTLLVDVPIMTNAEMPPSSVTTLPPPPISFIQPLQQTPVPTPIMVPSTSLQNLPTFSSVFKFKDRVKALEENFSEFKQTNSFAESVSSIPGIVDKYLANQMNEAVKAVVQLQSDRLREAAQAEKQDFINKIDENIKKIIKEQVKVQVKEQVSMILPRIKKSLNEQLEA
ncbi:hypothetical protein Tco_1502637 [Tanacetum coccineum]